MTSAIRFPPNLLLAFALCLAGSPGAWAAFGFQSLDGAFIVINHGGGNLNYRLTPSTGGEDPFDNYDFDTNRFIDQFYNYGTNPIILSGFIARTFEDGGDDITGVNFFWRQYELGTSPGLFSSLALAKTADLGGGDEEYQLLQSISLTTPGIGNFGGRVVLEVYAEAERAGGGSTQLGGRGPGNPFQAFYTDFAVPEPASAGLILLGLFALRHLHQRRLHARKASALRLG
jgi:hypothetical protein